MRKKKEVEGLTVAIDLPTTVEPVEPPPKKKKEISQKQRDALKKGMDALREKRKKLLDDDVVKPPNKDPVPQPVVAPPPPPAPERSSVKHQTLLSGVEHQIEPIVAPPPAPAPPAPPKVKKVRTPRPKYLTADDFNIFKNDLFNTLRPQTKAPEPTIESIVRPTQPNVLSGVSYLDEIFFKRK
jgi:hypothetical protein